MLEKTAENDIFETIQMPINAIDSHYHSFIKNVLPLAVEKNIGILAMKTLSNGRFFNQVKMLDKVQWESDDPLIPKYLSVREALYFVWSLPVSVLITGAENIDFLSEKIELAAGFTKITETERTELLGRVFEKAGNNIEYYKKT
jgi:predicted aldo/keto reductase-like oxidoreductase